MSMCDCAPPELDFRPPPDPSLIWSEFQVEENCPLLQPISIGPVNIIPDDYQLIIILVCALVAASLLLIGLTLLVRCICRRRPGVSTTSGSSNNILWKSQPIVQNISSVETSPSSRDGATNSNVARLKNGTNNTQWAYTQWNTMNRPGTSHDLHTTASITGSHHQLYTSRTQPRPTMVNNNLIISDNISHYEEITNRTNRLPPPRDPPPPIPSDCELAMSSTSASPTGHTPPTNHKRTINSGSRESGYGTQRRSPQEHYIKHLPARTEPRMGRPTVPQSHTSPQLAYAGNHLRNHSRTRDRTNTSRRLPNSGSLPYCADVQGMPPKIHSMTYV